MLDSANWQAVATPPVTPVAAAAPPKCLKLTFEMQFQEQSQWCWAALTASVWIYYAPTKVVTQCSLANLFFKQVNCCTVDGASSAACNQPYFVDTALAYAQCLNAPVLSERLIFSDVVGQIVAARPVGIRITWQGGGNVGHALCIVGYDCTDPDPDHATIDLKDPTYGESVVTYKGFPANYHSGSLWTHTYRTQACKPT
ncbi:papain-like cysteine protease family protein [Collimonas sp. OK242]|uniref:papain-like cysteine protease family protein n=1 Tax=Collimonas sp. OK242 TaxID=1798195 RepID=UPI000B85AEC3|nr:papain-like cysteine protease family protein [Collimonas sp. OK242]